MTEKSMSKRGMALLMVMITIGVTSVMAMAILAAATLQTSVAGVGHNRLQGQYLASSGLNLALYYIQNPKASPVPLVYGEWGSVHYPGETAIHFSTVPGELTIKVTNTAAKTLTIESVATTDGQVVTATATVKIEKSRTFEYASFNSGALNLGTKSKVVGGLITNGTVATPAAGQVSGTIVAANGAALGGVNFSADQSTSYPISMTAYMPTYFYNGKKCTAKTLPKNVPLVFLPDTDTINNPCNVWYAVQDSFFAYPLSINGTIVTAPGVSLNFSQSVTITPTFMMPALVVSKNLFINADNRTVRANGLTYIGGDLRATTGATNSWFRVYGSFLTATSGWPVHSSYKSSVHLERDASTAKVSGFADELENIDSLRITSWSIANGTP